MLISDYIADANTTAQSTDASCGEVSMEIDAFRHPATGELEGTIRGVFVCVLCWGRRGEGAQSPTYFVT